MELEKAYDIFYNIEREINRIADPYGDLSNEFKFNHKNADEKYKHDTAQKIVYQLSQVKDTLEWINQPILAEGYLTKNANGRYELDGIELTSGHPIEAWVNDDGWIKTRIEHRKDYCLYDLQEQDIKETLVRIR